MKKRGIKFKTVVSVVMAVTICLGIIGLLAYQYLKNMLMENVLTEAQKKVDDIVLQLDTLEEQMSTISDYIITDQAVIEHLYIGDNETIKDRNDSAYEMSNILTRFVVINDHINNIYLRRSDGWVYSNNRELDNRYLQPYLDSIIKQESADSNKFFTNLHSTPAYGPSRTSETISFMVRFSVISRGDLTEYLLLSIDYDKLSQMVATGATDFASISLLNNEGNVIYRTGEETVDTDKNTVFIEKATTNGNWNVVVAISKETLYGEINRILLWFVFIIFALAAVLIIVLIHTTSKITKPIEELSHAMKKVGDGHYDIQVAVNTNDEIEELANVFNGMIFKIRKYIQDSIQYEKTKQELQLDLLMNQINPHFIYNTLNSIIYCAHRNRPLGVEEITSALIHILQDSVKIGKHAIKDYVSVEVDIVRNYMKIQEYRYPERFAFELICSEDLYDVEIPKMMIQPLVENALFHGICLKEAKGMIRTRIQRKVCEGKKWIEIVVEDNGIGMSKKQADSCFEEKQKIVRNNKTRSIGLCNIKTRLEFLYGSDYYINVKSKEAIGTKIAIGFPEE